MSDKPSMPTEQEFHNAIVAGLHDDPNAYTLCWQIVCRVLECIEAGGEMVLPAIEGDSGEPTPRE